MCFLQLHFQQDWSGFAGIHIYRKKEVKLCKKWAQMVTLVKLSGIETACDVMS